MTQHVEPLQRRYQEWSRDCEEWMSDLESTYDKRKPEDAKAVREVISGMRSEIQRANKSLLRAAPTTNEEVTGLAYMAHFCLGETHEHHWELKQRSIGYSEAEKHVSKVEQDRQNLRQETDAILGRFIIQSSIPLAPVGQTVLSAASGQSAGPSTSGSAQPPSSPPPPYSGQVLGSSQPGVQAQGLQDDELFWLLDALPQNKKSRRIIGLTEKLLRGPLDDPKDQRRLAKLTVEELIAGWEKGVTHLVDQTNPAIASGDPLETSVAISALFFVHKQLQSQLYANLNATVIQQQPVTIQF